MLEHCCGDMLPFSQKRISEVGHCCWEIRPGAQSAFQFIPKVFGGDEVRALCKPVMIFQTDLDKPCLYGPCFVKVGSTESSRMSLYAVALRFPFTGTKEPKPWKKQPQTIIPLPPNFTVNTMVVFSWHLPNPELQSLLYRRTVPRVLCCTVPWSAKRQPRLNVYKNVRKCIFLPFSQNYAWPLPVNHFKKETRKERCNTILRAGLCPKKAPYSLYSALLSSAL